MTTCHHWVIHWFPFIPVKSVGSCRSSITLEYHVLFLFWRRRNRWPQLCCFFFIHLSNKRHLKSIKTVWRKLRRQTESRKRCVFTTLTEQINKQTKTSCLGRFVWWFRNLQQLMIVDTKRPVFILMFLIKLCCGEVLSASNGFNSFWWKQTDEMWRDPPGGSTRPQQDCIHHVSVILRRNMRN